MCLIRTNLAKNQNIPIIYRLIRYFEMLSGHRIPSPMCLAVGWEIQFHQFTRMLLSEDGEQFETTIHYVTQVTNLRQLGANMQYVSQVTNLRQRGVKFLLRTLSARQNLVPQFFGVSKYELL